MNKQFGMSGDNVTSGKAGCGRFGCWPIIFLVLATVVYFIFIR